MNFRLEVVCINDDGEEQRGEVLTMERRQLVMETLGLNLSESKVLLERVQDFVVARQVAEDLEQRRGCPELRRALHQQSERNNRSENVVRIG